MSAITVASRRTRRGFVKLHREAFDHWIYSDAKEFKAWVTILANAAWEPVKIKRRGPGLVVLDRGDVEISYRYLQRLCEWSPNRVREFLRRLQDENMLVLKRSGSDSGVGSIFSIVNFDTWQSQDSASDSADGSAFDSAFDSKEKKLRNNSSSSSENSTATPREESHSATLVGGQVPDWQPLAAVSAPDPGFSAFWELYPKKTSQREAIRAWGDLGPDGGLQTKIMAAVTSWSWSDGWQEQGGRYIPSPANFLRKRKWEDAPLVQQAQPADDIWSRKFAPDHDFGYDTQFWNKKREAEKNIAGQLRGDQG